MVISWYGEGSFRFQNGEISMVCDVADRSSGATIPRGKTSLYLQTITKWDKDNPLVISPLDAESHIYGAGEYDVAGIRVKGFQLVDESSPTSFKTVYKIVWDDILVGILGHISDGLSPSIQEHFSELDILIAPGGGEPFIQQPQVVKLIKQLNPKIFIPSFIPSKELKRKAQSPDTILTAFDSSGETQEKFTCKKKDFNEIKKTQVIVLSP